jgi:hypothetical protein
MRNISDLHNFIQFIERKERLSVHTHPEIDNALDAAQMDVFKDYHNIYLQTGKLPDALLPFKTTYSFTKTTCPLGLITMPSGNQQTISGKVVIFNNSLGIPVDKEIRFVDEDELIEALNSQLRPVSKKAPVGVNNNATIILYPAEAQAGVITYLKRPATPVYAYTQSGRAITYDALTSTQLEFSDLYLDKIIAKTLSYLGINLNEQSITQFGMIKDKETT